MFAVVLSLVSCAVSVGALARVLSRDLGALRRSRRTIRSALAEIAAQYPDAALTALAALEATRLPGDDSAAELQKGPG
jgi:hypothetical protein